MVQPTQHDVQGAFYVVEKRVPILGPAILKKVSELGAQISGGDGKIHAHVWIPVDHHDEILEALELDGFYVSQPYGRDRHP